MKPTRFIWVVLLIATAFCCWLSVLSLRHAHIRVVEARVISYPCLSAVPTHTTVTGILSDPNFRAVLHALEQRSGVEKLAEPEVVTTHWLVAVNRMYYDERFTFTVTNR